MHLPSGEMIEQTVLLLTAVPMPVLVERWRGVGLVTAGAVAAGSRLMFQTTGNCIVVKWHHHFLGPVPSRVDCPQKGGGDFRLIAPLAQQVFDGLPLIPALFLAHLGQVGRRFSVTSLVVELDAQAVHAHLPVEAIAAILEVGQERNGAVQVGELVQAHRRETAVFHWTNNSVLPEALVKRNRRKSTDTTAQLQVLAGLPRDKERESLIGERRGSGRHGVVQMGKQDIETVKAHFVARDRVMIAVGQSVGGRVIVRDDVIVRVMRGAGGGVHRVLFLAAAAGSHVT